MTLCSVHTSTRCTCQIIPSILSNLILYVHCVTSKHFSMYIYLFTVLKYVILSFFVFSTFSSQNQLFTPPVLLLFTFYVYRVNLLYVSRPHDLRRTPTRYVPSVWSLNVATRYVSLINKRLDLLFVYLFIYSFTYFRIAALTAHFLLLSPLLAWHLFNYKNYYTMGGKKNLVINLSDFTLTDPQI